MRSDLRAALEGHIRAFIKDLLKGRADVYDLERRVPEAETGLEAITRDFIDKTITEAFGATITKRLEAIHNDVNEMKAHIQYSLVKEIDLVRYDGEFYYWCT
jgi:hypothetical protein